MHHAENNIRMDNIFFARKLNVSTLRSQVNVFRFTRQGWAKWEQGPRRRPNCRHNSESRQYKSYSRTYDSALFQVSFPFQDPIA